MADNLLPFIVEIRTEEDIIIARQRGREMAKALGFGLVDQSRIATAISELTRNIIRYAGTGATVLRPYHHGLRSGIEIVCEDEGPGIADVELAMVEGMTTGKGLGVGLSGTKRLMDEMEIETAVGQGTKVTIRKWLR